MDPGTQASDTLQGLKDFTSVLGSQFFYLRKERVETISSQVLLIAPLSCAFSDEI